jgi:hypothetical protein
MLDVLKIELENTLVDTTNYDTIKKAIRKVIAKIDKYQEENNVLASAHSAMRVVEEYNTFYLNAIREYEAISPDKTNTRTWQVQEILTILNIIITNLSTTIRRYGTETDDKSTIGKNMRKLRQTLDDFKESRMSWLTTLKSHTTLTAYETEALKARCHGVDTGE